MPPPPEVVLAQWDHPVLCSSTALTSPEASLVLALRRQAMIHDINQSQQKHGDDFQRYRDENPDVCGSFKDVKVEMNLCNLKVCDTCTP